MANRYDTNLILDRIADSLDDDQNSALIASLDDIASAIGGGGGSGAGLVSDAFNDTRTYAVGEYCIHNNTLYRCTTAIQTPGAWDITDWQATNVGNELSTLNSNMLNLIKWKAISSSPAITVSANDVGTVQFNFTCDAGYKPLFIICGGASTTAVIPIRGGYPLSENATSCSVQVREITGTTRTNVTLGATLIQIKETSR